MSAHWSLKQVQKGWLERSQLLNFESLWLSLENKQMRSSMDFQRDQVRLFLNHAHTFLCLSFFSRGEFRNCTDVVLMAERPTSLGAGKNHLLLVTETVSTRPRQLSPLDATSDSNYWMRSCWHALAKLSALSHCSTLWKRWDTDVPTLTAHISNLRGKNTMQKQNKYKINPPDL